MDLGDLPYARGARFQEGKKCLPGTRQALLTKLKEWVDDSDPKTKGILILVGDKGTGKSAVAHSISHHYHGLHRLGSSIFVASTKEAAETRMPLRFFPTIAQDLATLDLRYRHKLWHVIKADKALRNTLDPIAQLESFMLAPLSGLALAGPVALVIDGIENCDDLDSLGQFLAILAERIKDLPSNFRILLTTRPDSQVLHHFINHPNVQIEHLDGPGAVSTYSDLFKYAKFRLSTSRHSSSLVPRHVDCLDLVKSSQGSFLWMSLVCDKICADYSDTKLPERIRAAVSSCGPSTRLPPADDLYDRTLCHLFDPQDCTAMAQFRGVMGILLASYRLLSLSDLVKFRDHSLEEGDILAVVAKMHGLLMNTTCLFVPLAPFHPSFFEFIRDPQRSQHFFVDIADHHHILAKACIRVLNEQLQFNICHLPSSYLRNDEVVDLPDRFRRFISPELAYASQFWLDHLCAVPGPVPEALIAEIELLLHARLFFWLEVLSLLGSVDCATTGLAKILDWSHVAVSLCLWLNCRSTLDFNSFLQVEAHSFVRTFETAIKLSTPHIYVSAIRFWQTIHPGQFLPRFKFPECVSSPVMTQAWLIIICTES